MKTNKAICRYCQRTLFSTQSKREGVCGLCVEDAPDTFQKDIYTRRKILIGLLEEYKNVFFSNEELVSSFFWTSNRQRMRSDLNYFVSKKVIVAVCLGGITRFSMLS